MIIWIQIQLFPCKKQIVLIKRVTIVYSKVVGVVGFLGKKCCCWSHCLLSALNFANGKSLQFSLSYSSSPSYKSIKNLLATLKDDNIPKVREEKKSNTHGIIRGDRFYADKIAGSVCPEW